MIIFARCRVYYRPTRKLIRIVLKMVQSPVFLKYFLILFRYLSVIKQLSRYYIYLRILCRHVADEKFVNTVVDVSTVLIGEYETLNYKLLVFGIYLLKEIILCFVYN